jgi:DNA polymerase III alpha subunit
MKNFVTPHCHLKSLDTGASIDAFAKREAELGTGYLTCTDHGSMAAARQVVSAAKKHGLTAINGCEFYLRDDDCDVLKRFGIPKDEEGGYGSFYKYAHVTAHFKDNDAFEAASRLLSKADDRGEKHGSERKPLFSWSDLEELGGHNVTFCSSCLIGIVGRFLVQHNRPDIAVAYYEKLRSLVKPGNFYVEMFPHKCTHYWESGTFVTVEGGERYKWHHTKTIMTDKGEVKLNELSKLLKAGPTTLLAVKNYSTWQDLEPKQIIDVNSVEDFLLNECRPWAPDSDLQLGMNKFMMRLAKKYGDKILVSDDAHFAYPSDKIVQDIRLQSGGGNWKFHNSYHRQDSGEAFAYFKDVMGVSEATYEGWVENSHEWADGFKGFKFPKRTSLPKSFYPPDTLRHTMDLIKKHGRMDWKNKVYVGRIKAEIDLLHKNGTIDLLPYFFVDEEVCSVHAETGILTGAGRGSASGLLLSYLIGITHVDPIKYNLSMDRFLTLDRIQQGKLPDIDLDLPSRDLLAGEDGKGGWLKERFGDCYAQVSTEITLKLKSSIKDVSRVEFGRVPFEIEQLVSKMGVPPQGISDRDYIFGYTGADGQPVQGAIDTDVYLQAFVRQYPVLWEKVQKVLSLTRALSRHASAYLVCDEPISNFIPLTTVGGVKVTQFTAGPAEEAGALKYDFLVVNSLKDVSDAIKLVQEKNGYTDKQSQILNGRKVPHFRIVPHNGELHDIWDLPEDQKVFDDICEGRTETVFQFNTPGAQKWLVPFNEKKSGSENKLLDSIMALSNFTALDRPGPLDALMTDETGHQHNMLVEYARRAKLGKGNYKTDLPILDELLPETYGVIVYQEQLTRIFKQMGNTTGIEAENFRVHISKKQMAKVAEDRKIFMNGAIPKIGEPDAVRLWDMMATFAAYGFCMAHSTAYVHISYACAFLKHHYPLQWWTAVLRNASKNEISEKFWPYCGHLIKMPDIRNATDNFDIIGDKVQAPLSLLQGIGATAHKELVEVSKGANSIADLFKNINARKEATKTADGKLGRSALSRRVMYTLIVSGTMDSFFASDATMLDKLMAYEAAAAQNQLDTGKRKKLKVSPVDSAFVDLNERQVYQLRKSILSSYDDDLYKMLCKHDSVSVGANGYVFKKSTASGQTRHLTVVKPEKISYFDTLDVWEDGASLTVALPCYIMGDERRTYGSDKKPMAKLTVNSNGETFEFVRWPIWNTKDLGEDFTESLTGSMGMLTLEKRAKNKPFSVVGYDMMQAPFKMGKEESSD